jgi:hypothetical protein
MPVQESADRRAENTYENPAGAGSTVERAA